MQTNIYPMIAGRIQSPEHVLQAEAAVDERKILRRRIERKPDALQAIGGGQKRIGGDVDVVIPDETGAPNLLIGRDRRGN